jgi:hypothetical protein
MARTKISEFSATAADNTDIDNINIAEGCAPSGINNAIRELMAQLKDMQTGASGDTFTLTTVNSTTVDTTNLEATNLKAKDGTAAGSIADSTGIVTLASTVLTTTDINGGTIDGTSIGASTPSTVVATQVDITAQGDLRLQDTTGGQYVALQAPGTVATSYTLTLPVDDGTAGQALITDGSGVLSWSSAASGDVYGPASATDNAVARYDGTTGKIIQNSAVTIADDGATVIAANSTSDGLRITQIGTGNALTVEDSANPDSSPFVINGVGQVIAGATQNYNSAGGRTPIFQLNGTDYSFGAASVSRWSADNQSFYLGLNKSRGATAGTQTVVQNGDALGAIEFTGSDGTGFIPAAGVYALVDGTPGTNDMPGRLVFATTADGASSPTEAMRIRSDRNIGIGGSGNATSKVSVGGTYATSGGFSSGFETAAVIPSGTTTLHANFDSKVYTQAASFTLGTLHHFAATQPSAFGAGSTVTTQVGFNAQSNLTGATNNYGFYGNIAAGTGRWNFYAAGTASNYFAGNVGVGNTTPNAPLEVVSTAASIVSRSTSATQSSVIFAAASDYYSTPSFRSVGMLQYNASATGTTLGLSNANLGVLNFQNGSNAAIQTNGSNILRIGTLGTTAISIAANQIISLGAAPGSESLRVTPVASAVNYLNVYGGATGNSTLIDTSGSDTNVSMQFRTKGTGDFFYYTGDYTRPQFRIAHTASAVNYLQVTGAATGGGATLSAQGSDTDISVIYKNKGTGVHFFQTSNTNQFVITHQASAVNYAGVQGSTTGNAPLFYVQGSDTNIDLSLVPKGTGNVRFGTLTANADAPITGYITIKDSAGNLRKLAVIA